MRILDDEQDTAPHPLTVDATPDSNALATLQAVSLRRLEWPAMLAQITAGCETHYGQQLWAASPFFNSPEDAIAHMAQVQALASFCARHTWPSLSSPVLKERVAKTDLRPVIVRLQKGSVLNQQEAMVLRGVLQLARQWSTSLQQDGVTRPLTEPLIDLLNHMPLECRRQVNQYLNEQGEWSTQASPVLALSLQQQQQLQQQAADRLQQVLRDAAMASQLQNPNVTLRQGQCVLAVKAVYKHSFPGEVVDDSGTGATVYMVPHAVSSLNKRLQALQLAIDAEIFRLLQNMSALVLTHAEALLQGLDGVALTDKCLAGARWAKKMTATSPAIVQAESPHASSIFEVIQLRHPLIDNPVPNTIRLGKTARTMVITGPNTGGKTVLLKTMGLAALLVRAGMPLPADADSRLSWFTGVYADIGDEQGLAQNLSTFSAHLVTLRALTQPDQDLHNRLILLDELAAGTDPTEAAALAEAVLRHVQDHGALTVVTTHLGRLKTLASDYPGFQNASVTFNAETLSPTYQLVQGLPGTSHALSIAQRLGLNPAVIAMATTAMQTGEKNTAQLLEHLNAQQLTIQQELDRAKAYREASQSEFERLEDERQQLEYDRRQALHQMKSSVKQQSRAIHQQLKKLRKAVGKAESTATPSRFKTARLADVLHHVDAYADATFAAVATNDSHNPPAKTALSPYKVGQTVFCVPLQTNMDITAIKGQKIHVALGVLKSVVDVSDIEPKRTNKRYQPPKALVQQAERPAYTMPSSDLSSTVCDVRGQSAEEALNTLALFVDQALLAGLETVSVIHGLGTGVLKQALRQALRSHIGVKSFTPAPAVDGGDGKTIISLKK
jgi:DNA mismatch repair protein MutS2